MKLPLNIEIGSSNFFGDFSVVTKTKSRHVSNPGLTPPPPFA